MFVFLAVIIVLGIFVLDAIGFAMNNFLTNQCENLHKTFNDTTDISSVSPYRFQKTTNLKDCEQLLIALMTSNIRSLVKHSPQTIEVGTLQYVLDSEQEIDDLCVELHSFIETSEKL